MLWYEYIITTGVPTVAIIIVGFILKNQIVSQKSLLKQYNNYIKSVDPSKIVLLKDAEYESLKRASSDNIRELQMQVIDLGRYVDYILTRNEETAKLMGQPELFVRHEVISRLMPKCSGILEEIHHITHSKQPSP